MRVSPRLTLSFDHQTQIALNTAIGEGQVQNVAAQPVRSPLAEGLITTDRKVVYRVDDGIPVMLPEEGIGTLQLRDFPAAA